MKLAASMAFSGGRPRSRAKPPAGPAGGAVTAPRSFSRPQRVSRGGWVLLGDGRKIICEDRKGWRGETYESMPELLGTHVRQGQGIRQLRPAGRGH
jgi:hypothetical protein